MFNTLPESSLASMHPAMVIGALLCAVIAACILLWYLVRRPPMNWGTRFALLAGLGIFPLGTSMLGNVANYMHTQERAFCGSCHVMGPYQEDSENPASMTLASRHARNDVFGHENCYHCHEDYGMFGLVYTKIGGLGHVWYYYTEYHDYTLEEAKEKIHIKAPFPNRNCTSCHSMKNPGWRSKRDHASMLSELEASTVSCASQGCHGPAHPFSKKPEELTGKKPVPHGTEQPSVVPTPDAGATPEGGSTPDGGHP